MRNLLFSIFGLAALLYAQCNLCTVNNTLPPRTFDPAVLVIDAGVDTMVVIQFALPETVSAPSSLNYVYPNFAVYVDSLKMDGGNTYVSLIGNPSVAPAYNSANPAAGAMRFDQNHRLKQVRSNAPTHSNVVVYRNPDGGSPSNPTPPRGCVQACIRGIQPTPQGGADTLRILLRGFVDPNSINLITGQSSDIANKDTSNLMPTLAGQPLYSDVWSGYPVIVRGTSTTVKHSILSGVSLMPNPAWGHAALTYTLNRPAEVRFRILTLSGAEVQYHDVGLQPAGFYEHTIALPAGVYLIELQAGPEKLLQKIVIL